MNRMTVAVAGQMAAAWVLAVAAVFYWVTQTACGVSTSGGQEDVFGQVGQADRNTITVPPTPGGGSTTEPPFEQVPTSGFVRIAVRLPQATASEAGARLVPSATRYIRVTVTAADIATPVEGEAAVSPGQTSVELSLEVPAGADRQLTVQALDENRNVLSSGTATIVVEPAQTIQASISLVPEASIYPTVVATAASPIRVGTASTLGGSATDSDGTIVEYAWDFEADGTYDWTNASSPATTHTYPSALTYTAVLRATDNDGLTSTASVNIKVSTPPEATANASPTDAVAGAPVSFSGTGSDADGSITKYEWDFDGNGTYDWSSAGSASTSHSYGASGAYTAVLRVTDDCALTAEAFVAVTVTAPPSGDPPTVTTATASPNKVAPGSPVSFSGTATDPDGAIAKYEWDFDGNGTYDWFSASTPDTTHSYPADGTFAATLRATDGDGMTGEQSVQVIVSSTGTLMLEIY